MALPIVGLYLKKVFADKSLGYSQTEQFVSIPGYSVCDKSGDKDVTDAPPPAQIDDMFK
jgi:penicillin-binding protein 1A